MADPGAILVTDFGGMTPLRITTLLDTTEAAEAVNCRLRSGGLEGLRHLKLVEDLNQSPIYSGERGPPIAYAIGTDPDDYVWLPFNNKDVKLLRGSIIDDEYSRYYWTGDGAPKYNTEERIRNGDPPLLLGVPGPVNAPTVDPYVPSDPNLQAARAYTYTFVSPYGEEGPPAPPTVATGGEGLWTISGFDTEIPDMGLRAPGDWLIRIYRTVSGAETVSYYFVADIPFGQTSYEDRNGSDVVVLNSILESEDWDPPPEGLDYLVEHPNGFMVGFVGSDIYMSIPYRPHAWPREYVLSTEYPIVALGVFGQSVAALTRANPYIMSGVEPLAMTFTKTSATTPCLSRYGVVPFDFGVLFPSDRGLMLVDGTRATNVTEDLVLARQWREYYAPEDFISATRDGDDYLAFYKNDMAFRFSARKQAAWSEVDAFTQVSSVFLNTLTGRVHLLSAGVLYDWDNFEMLPVQYRWKSKNFRFKAPLNLGAARAMIDDGAGDPTDPAYDRNGIEEFNEARFPYPLAPIGTKGFGYVHVYPLGDTPPTLPQNQDPAAGSALREMRLGQTQNLYLFKLWADEKLILETYVRGDELVSLPSGYKAERWQFELTSYQRIHNFVIGTSPKALKQA